MDRIIHALWTHWPLAAFVAIVEGVAAWLTYASALRHFERNLPSDGEAFDTFHPF